MKPNGAKKKNGWIYSLARALAERLSPMPSTMSKARREAKVERLNQVGRVRFELEEYVSRCRLHRRQPSLLALESLLRVTED